MERILKKRKGREGREWMSESDRGGWEMNAVEVSDIGVKYFSSLYASSTRATNFPSHFSSSLPASRSIREKTDQRAMRKSHRGPWGQQGSNYVSH